MAAVTKGDVLAYITSCLVPTRPSYHTRARASTQAGLRELRTGLWVH